MREWLIRLLIGKRPVVANCELLWGRLVIPAEGALMHGTRVLGPENMTLAEARTCDVE